MFAAMTTTHQLELDVRYGTHYTAYCSCGWNSETYGPEWEASHDTNAAQAAVQAWDGHACLYLSLSPLSRVKALEPRPDQQMTLDEFERGYAERSGLTGEQLHELGLYGIPCNCSDETCDGWQMDWGHRQERAK